MTQDDTLQAPQRTVRLWLQFEGTDFCGFQRQGDLRTVQGEFERAWQDFIGERASLRASSRTDAGVHARRMPLCVRTRAKVPLRGLSLGLNTHLPPDLAVLSADEMPPEFDVRGDAVNKRYIYRMITSEARAPLLARTAYHVHGALDVPAMQRAATCFEGIHDFAAFRAAACTAHSTVRHLRSVRVEAAEAPLLTITVEGNAFLHNMVRIIAGTLIDVGRRRIAADAIPAIIASRDRTRAGQTAPPQGLTLDDVFYGPPGARQGLDYKDLLGHMNRATEDGY